MRAVNANEVLHHVEDSGPPGAPTVLFANSLGTDLRVWDAVLPLLPRGLRYVRYDMRGHGLSETPDGPWSIAELAADAAALIEALDAGPVFFVGLSIGGMVGQQLAADRPDLVKALVLTNTAPRMGDPGLWHDRIAAIEAAGLPGMASAILERWFSPAFLHRPEARLWEAMLTRTPVTGYLACCGAIAAADLSETSSALRLPVLAIAGGADGACPPEAVAAMAGRIARARIETIETAGHLPCVETPDAFAAILTSFLEAHAHA